MPDFTPAQWVIIGSSAAVQFVLLAVSLVMIARTPDERLTLPRFAWILLCFVQFVGPIAFFAAGRKPVPHVDGVRSPNGAPAVESVIDELYPKS